MLVKTLAPCCRQRGTGFVCEGWGGTLATAWQVYVHVCVGCRGQGVDLQLCFKMPWRKGQGDKPYLHAELLFF